MKRLLAMLLLLTLMLPLAGCELFGMQGDGSKKIEEEFPTSTGCWRLLSDEDTYFTLDGTRGVMTFSYVEDGKEKYTGTYRAIWRGVGEDVLTPLSLTLIRDDKEKEDWLSLYAENVDTAFTQFTVMEEEEDLGMTDGTVYTHIYRISELPYKMGTYVLEGNEYKEEANSYSAANKHCIPSGRYALESGECFTFLMTKPRSHELFRYENGDTVVEGSLWIGADKKTAYLYIEHDPYSKVTRADKEHYDTTFNIYYPPDFYLRGDFSDPEAIVIDSLYHHEYSPTKITDDTWVFGTYVKK